MTLREDAATIVQSALAAGRPDAEIRKTLASRECTGRLVVISTGKAAHAMAMAAHDVLGERVDSGFIVSSSLYAPVMQPSPPSVRIDAAPKMDISNDGCQVMPVPGFDFLEADHPLTGKNSLFATRTVLDATEALTASDTVLFLLSGGASAMFEDPLVPLQELRRINDTLLLSGAGIAQVNAVRKRLSRVKGGRFAKWCAPAHVLTLVLSDVPNGKMDTVASGPTCLDTSTCKDAIEAIESCGCTLSEQTWRLLGNEMPRQLDNAETMLVGDASLLVEGARNACCRLGYRPELLDGPITGEAADVGRMLAGIANDTEHNEQDTPCPRYGQAPQNASYPSSEHVPTAWIGTGETTVHVQGNGLGGRNLEVALSAAHLLDGRDDTCVLSIGSDGRDGPAPVAGGFACGNTAPALRSQEIDIESALADNDSYHALAAADGLVTTGITGTNVGDLMLVLMR